MGLQACVECPFKLFRAQSGVFFSSDLKMGIRGHSFFLPGSPLPLFLLAPTLTRFHSLSLSLMLCRTLSWSHAGTYTHAGRHKEIKQPRAYAHMYRHRYLVMHTWHARTYRDAQTHWTGHPCSPAVSSIVCVGTLFIVLLCFHVSEYILTFSCTARMWSIIALHATCFCVELTVGDKGGLADCGRQGAGEDVVLW